MISTAKWRAFVQSHIRLLNSNHAASGPADRRSLGTRPSSNTMSSLMWVSSHRHKYCLPILKLCPRNISRSETSLSCCYRPYCYLLGGGGGRVSFARAARLVCGPMSSHEWGQRSRLLYRVRLPSLSFCQSVLQFLRYAYFENLTNKVQVQG